MFAPGVSDISCDGAGSVVPAGDCVVPPLPYGICTAYDDCYDIPPERLVAAAERLGYRRTINHYIGMSHYSTLGADGMVDPGQGMNAAARAWHVELARAAKAHDYELIFSVSFELPETRCPAAWAQRTSDGAKGLTGYEPRSVLLSPANIAAQQYLQKITRELVAIAVAAGLTSPTCRASFGDDRCRVDLAGRTMRARVTAVAGDRLTLDAAVDGRFLFGRLRFLDAANTGLSSAVWASAGHEVRLRAMPGKAVVAGTRIELREGCDKRIATCAGRFANAVNFRGEPQVPGNDLLLRYPGQ